jgi:hypothetical protein
MGAFSGFLILFGIMTLFCSAMSLGLTFLNSIQGDSWAPLRTGPFLTHYVGVDFGVERLFDWLGWGGVWNIVMEEPLYHILFILGVVIVFVALAVRSMGRDA